MYLELQEDERCYNYMELLDVVGLPVPHGLW